MKAFEARVREGTAARNPSLFEFGGRVYRVVSTGIFDAGRLADSPAGGVIRSSRCGATSIRHDPGDNVYFELEPTEDSARG